MDSDKQANAHRTDGDSFALVALPVAAATASSGVEVMGFNVNSFV